MTTRYATTLFVLVLLCGMIAVPATAQVTRYVATTGDDLAGENDCTDPNNPCATIQQAVTAADANVGADDIEIAAGTYVESEISIGGEVMTIQGAGAATTIIDAQGSGRIFSVGSSDLILNDLTLRNGASFEGGALRYQSVQGEINRCIIENNSASDIQFGNGGGLYSDFSTLSITSTSFIGNTASTFGGGLFARGSDLTFTGTTFSGNTADEGGGLYLEQSSDGGSAVLTNTTVANNTASTEGGGLYYREFSFGSISIRSTTFAGNTASAGGGVFFDPVEGSEGVLEYGNSLFANNAAGNVVQGGFGAGTLNSLGFNLLDDASGDPTPASTDQLDTTARLEPLADNGGPTQTLLPQTSSPVLDAGNCAVAVDQRGDPRPYDNPGLPNAPGGDGCDIGAVELQAGEFAPTTRFVATTGTDGANDCTDQEAPCATVEHAVTVAGPGDTIDIAAGTYTEFGITLNKNLTVTGAGAASTTLQGAAQPGNAPDRLFFIVSGVAVDFSDLTLSNGVADGDDGGAILAESQTTLTVQRSVFRGHRALNLEGGGLGGAIFAAGALTIQDSFFEDNQASNNDGGAVYYGNSLGAVLIARSTFAANSANNGGALYLSFGAGTQTLELNTFAGNTASGAGGAVFFEGLGGELVVTSNTFVGNAASSQGGAINFERVEVGTVTYGNSIFSQNSPENLSVTDNVSGPEPFQSLGYNLLSDASGDPTPSLTDQVNTFADLEPLAANGGISPTALPRSTSPALDAGNCSAATDQRGETRPVDLPLIPNAFLGCDVGAVELQDAEFAPLTRYVSTTGDDAFGENDCSNQNDPCATIENALNYAQNGETVRIFGGTYTEAGLLVGQSIRIQGDGPDATIVQAAADPGTAFDRVLTLQSGTTAEVLDLTVQHGVAAEGSGGGLLSLGQLTVDNVAFRANQSDGSGGAIDAPSGRLVVRNSLFVNNDALGATGMGGAIRVTEGTIEASTFVQNSADQGGGVAFDAPTESVLDVINSTFSENAASTSGGALFYETQGFSFLRVASSTFFLNDAPTAASIGFAGNSEEGNLDYVNSIFAASGANFDVPTDPAFVSLGANIFTDDPGGTFDGDQINTDPLLLSLADNGGLTPTHLPLAASPAIDRGTCTDGPVEDQRGEPRPYDDPGTPNFNEGCDVGAVEVQAGEFLQGPDLALTKDDGGITAEPGEIIVYQITASNPGDVTATDILLTEELPANTTFVPEESSAWVDSGEGVYTLSIDALEPQGSTVAAFTVQVDVSPPAEADPIANTVEGIDSFGNTASASDTTPLLLGADLELSKTVDNAEPGPGEVVTFTLTLTNQGPLAATDVVVTDVLPEGLTFVGATPDAAYEPATGAWTVGALAAEGTTTLEIQVQGVDPTTFTNRAEVTQATPFDPDSTPGNGSTDEDDDAEVSITILAPGIDIAPDLLQFGEVAIGETATAPVVVTNTGTATLQVEAQSIAGPDRASFRLGSAKAMPPVPPGGQTEIPVTFAPTEGGDKVATLVLESNLGVFTVGLRGTATGPVLAISPSSVDFGAVAPDSTAERLVTLTNDGTAALTVVSVQVTGADAGSFTAPEAATVGAIPPGESAVLSVQFADPEPGTKQALLEIESDGGAAVLPLEGRVLALRITLDPAAVDFGTVEIGTQAQAAVRVTNDGEVPLTLDELSVEGAHASDFAAAGTTGEVPPGATRPVAVTFAPSAEGARSAVLTLSFTRETIEVPLSGEGAEPEPEPVFSAEVTPETLDFGEVSLGESVSLEVTVENTGTAPVGITEARIEGASAFSFGTVPATVAVEATATIPVTFTADAPGTQTAEAVLETDAGTFRVGLQAQVPAAAELAVSPSTVDFGDVFVGASREQAVQVSNPGGTTLALDAVTVSGGEAFSVDGGPEAIAAGGSETVIVRFAPTGPGVQTATLQVDAANADDATIGLTGIGTRPELTVSVTPDPAAAGQPITVAVSAPPGFDPGQGQLFYRPGGATSFTSVALSAQGGGFGASIPGTAVTERGVDYYLSLTEGPVTGTFPTEQAAQIPAHLRVRLGALSTQRSLAPGTYAIVAPALVPDEPDPEAVFGDDYGLPYDPAVWRALRWNAEREDYDEVPDLPGFTPGRAFWLISDSGAPYTVGPGISIDASVAAPAAGRSEAAAAQQVMLAPGWNMIGGFYPFDVAWADVEAPSSVNAPQAWDSALDDFVANQTVLERERGYFVLNTASQPVTLTVPPIAATGASKTEPSPPWAAADYALNITARVPAHDLVDRTNVVGLAATAQDGWDALDVGEPPPVGDHVRLSIVTPGGTTPPSERMAASLKPMGGDGQQWELELTAALPSVPYALRKEVHLQFVEHGQRPDGFEVYVLDLDRGVPLLASAPVEGGTVTVTLSGERPVARLRVLLGTEYYAEAHDDGISLEATETLLEPPYPNPFNPETVIGYRLREPAEVVLEIYDALGRRVRQLVSTEQPAGRHEVIWDARDDRGRAVASGVYFCRMQAGEYVATRTLSLVR